MPNAPYCPDPRAIPAVSDVTHLPSEDATREQRAVEAADRKEDERRWEAGIQSVDQQGGYAAFDRDYRMSDPQQRAFIDAIAATADHNGFRVLQGIAAAGSGKTRCVVLGLAKVFYEGKLNPTKIVCTTFTKKASKELIERLCRYIPKHSVLTQLRVGTFHSGRVSGQGLRNAGARSSNKLITDLSPILRLILDRPRPNDPNPFIANVAGVTARNLAENLGGLAPAVKSYSDLITNKFEPWGMRSPDDVRAFFADVRTSGGPDKLSRADRERFDAVLKARNLSANDEVYPAFPEVWADAIKVKSARKEMTFNDLLGDYLAVAHRDAVNLFIVDESQDNSWVQLQIALRAAKAGNGTLVLVGDGRQGIYRFRGADPTIFQFARTDFNAQAVDIGTNYRSGYWIVEAGNVVCVDEHTGRQAEWAIGEPAIAGRRNTDGTPFQGTITVDHYSAAVRGIVSGDEIPTGADTPPTKKKQKKGQFQIAGEVPAARAIAEQIAPTCREEPDGTFSLVDSTAIITRTNAPLGAFELALSRYRIPCVYSGGRGNFMSRGPVLAMLRLMSLASGVVEDPDLAGRMLHKVLRDPGGRWWGDRFKFMRNEDFFSTVRGNWHNGLLATLEAFRRLNRKWASAAEQFAADVEPLCTADWSTAPALAAGVFRGWEGLNARSEQDEADEADEGEDAEAIDEDPTDSYYQSLADIAATFESYAEFMGYVAKAKDTVTVGEGEAKSGAVTLTTAHRSKGLEWHTVHLIAPFGVWPHYRAEGEAEREEECRLYYVGVTRAADALHVHSYGDRASPLTDRVFLQGILPRMQQARIEAARAARLAEVSIQEVEEGRDGRIVFAVYHQGVRVKLAGRTTWATYDDAADAWIENDPETTPLAGRVERFLAWLDRARPGLARDLRAHPRAIEAIIADEAVGEDLGWSTLEGVFPAFPGDLEIQTTTGRTIGYLLRGRPTVFHGYLELRAPWSDYVLTSIPDNATPTTYGTRFIDNTFALIEARYQYAATRPTLGSGIPLMPATVRPHDLIERGPTAAEVIEAQYTEPEPDATPTPTPASIPIEATLGAPNDQGEVLPSIAPRRLLPVKLDRIGGELSSWSVVVLASDGRKIATVELARYAEVPLLERTLVQHHAGGVFTLYRVMAGATDKVGRLMGTLQRIATGDRSYLKTFDYVTAARDVEDGALRMFLATPDVQPQDQILWETTLSRAFKFDCGRLVDLNGNVLLRVEPDDLTRILRSGWFHRDVTSTGSSFRWDDEKIRRAYEA